MVVGWLEGDGSIRGCNEGAVAIMVFKEFQASHQSLQKIEHIYIYNSVMNILGRDKQLYIPMNPGLRYIAKNSEQN
jgi:hypothetical protein